jgi:hypothetical protein
MLCNFDDEGLPKLESRLRCQLWEIERHVNTGSHGLVESVDPICGQKEDSFEVFEHAKEYWKAVS